MAEFSPFSALTATYIVFRLPEIGASGYSAGSGLCVPNAGDLFADGMQARIGGPLAPPP